MGRYLKQGSGRAFRTDSGSYRHLKRQVSATASGKRKSRQLSLLTALPTGSSGQPSKPPSRTPYEPRPAPLGAGSSAYPVLSGSFTHGREPRGRDSQTAGALLDKDARAPLSSVPRYEHRAKAPAPRPAWAQPPAALQLHFPGTSVEKLNKLWRPRLPLTSPN